MSKNNIDVSKLIKLSLFSIKNPKLGYVLANNVLDMRNSWGETYTSSWGENYTSYNDFIEERVIVTKPNPLIRPKQVTEYLTGESFDYVTHRFNHISSSHKELDTFVIGGISSCHEEVTIEELWRYIERHGNVEKYKKYLQELKENSKNLHIQKKEFEEYNAFIKDIRKHLLEEGLDEFKNNPRIMKVCIQLFNNQNVIELKNITIEELMFKTKKINPTLSNEECLSIASVILRVQNTISANAKRKLKIAN